MVTSRIRLGSLAELAASGEFRAPVHGAGLCVRRRLVLGLGAGAGGASYDTNVSGFPALTIWERAERLAEFAELLDLLLREDRVTWRGSYYEAVGARNLPGCLQQPRVPFVIAADSPPSIALPARLAEGWVTIGHGPGADDRDAWWDSLADKIRRSDDAFTDAGRIASQVGKYVSLDASSIYARCRARSTSPRPLAELASWRAGVHRRHYALAAAGRDLCRLGVGA